MNQDIGKNGGLVETEAPVSGDKTPCCYRAHNQYPVYWNPYNKAVQCHSCGEQYVPMVKVSIIRDALAKIKYLIFTEQSKKIATEALDKFFDRKPRQEK